MYNRSVIAIVVAAAACAHPAFAAGKNAAPAAPSQSLRVSELTPSECERLGGEITVVGRRTCITREQCVVIKPNGDTHTVCIDEIE